MNFDRLLDRLFRKGGLILIMLIIVAAMALSSCLLTETLSLGCYACGYVCGCEDACAEVCWACGEECDKEIHSSLPEDCALADCLFDDGCVYYDDALEIHCGGLGSGCYSKGCRDEDFSAPHDGCTCVGGFCEGGCGDCYIRVGESYDSCD